MYLYWYCGLVTLVLVIAAVVTGGALARGFAALVVLFCVLQCGKFVPGASKLAEALPAVVRGGLYVEFFLAAFVLAFAVTAALGLDRWPRSWTWVVPIVVAAELIWSGSHRPMNSAPTGWRETSSETSFVNDRKFPALLHKLVGTTTPPLRIDTFDLAFDFTQSTSLRRLPTPNGDNALAPMRVLEIRRLFTVGNWWERQYPVRKFESPWLDFLNVGYLLDLQHPVDKDALLHAGWEEVPSGMWARLFRNLEVMPRFFLAAKVRAVRDAQESLQAAQNLDPRQEAVVEGAAPPAEASGRVEVIDYRNNRVTLTSESAGRSLLVTSETWSPGWKAKVDGRLVDLLVVNHAFRGLALDAGQHRIEMTYSPGYVWPLLGLGLVWFGLLLFLACR